MLQRRLYFSKPELRDSLHYAYMRPKSFDVRKGSKTEVTASRQDVCFTLVSGHRQASATCPKTFTISDIDHGWRRVFIALILG